MDQGVAAVWAGIAGLAGAGIGGGFAAWGSWIGGKKAVEAAERAEQRAAAAAHQHWLREKRYEAYKDFLAVIQEVSLWREPDFATARSVSVRLRDLLQGVAVLGPEEVAVAAARATAPVMDALLEARATANNPAGPMPPGALVSWPPARAQQARTAQSVLRKAVSGVLGAPPT